MGLNPSLQRPHFESFILLGLNHLEDPTFGEDSAITTFDIFANFCVKEDRDVFLQKFSTSQYNPRYRRECAAYAAVVAAQAVTAVQQYYLPPPDYFLKGELEAIFFDLESDDDEEKEEEEE
jgi:hypothetical protein